MEDQEKVCSKCTIEKRLSEFRNKKGGKYGVSSSCKKCEAKSHKEARDKNPEKFRARVKKSRLKHLEKSLERERRYSRLRTSEYRLEVTRRYRKNNPEKVRADGRKQMAKKLSNPSARLAHAVSSNIHNSIVRGSKQGKTTFALLGYSRDDLVSHLENKFVEGMTWDNYGPVWHVDHVIPKSKFKYETPECHGFKAAWALSNLQPLFAEDNLKKNDRLDHPSQI